MAGRKLPPGVGVALASGVALGFLLLMLGQTGSGSGVGFDNDSVVPYRSVLGLFREFANFQLDRQQVPITLKDLVRDYFSRLEPTE